MKIIVRDEYGETIATGEGDTLLDAYDDVRSLIEQTDKRTAASTRAESVAEYAKRCESVGYTVGVVAFTHKEWRLLSMGGLPSYHEQQAVATSAMQGDVDGWVRWANHRPPIGVEVEVKNEGDEETRRVTPMPESLNWNVDGLLWRAV